MKTGNLVMINYKSGSKYNFPRLGHPGNSHQNDIGIILYEYKEVSDVYHYFQILLNNGKSKMICDHYLAVIV
jgi:hypothetical protein